MSTIVTRGYGSKRGIVVTFGFGDNASLTVVIKYPADEVAVVFEKSNESGAIFDKLNLEYETLFEKTSDARVSIFIKTNENEAIFENITIGEPQWGQVPPVNGEILIDNIIEHEASIEIINTTEALMEKLNSTEISMEYLIDTEAIMEKTNTTDFIFEIAGEN